MPSSVIVSGLESVIALLSKSRLASLERMANSSAKSAHVNALGTSWWLPRRAQTATVAQIVSPANGLSV